jgi:hypothetical protein
MLGTAQEVKAMSLLLGSLTPKEIRIRGMRGQGLRV